MVNENSNLNKNLNISSVIYSARIDEEFNIAKVLELYKNVNVFQKNKVNFKVGKNKTAVSLVKNRYIRVMGLKSINKSKSFLKEILNTLKKGKVISGEYKVENEQVENIVASGVVDSSIDLENVLPLLKNAIYEPEQFPSIIYRPRGKIVLLLFATGKIVIVGATNINEINTEYQNIKKIISEM